MANLRRVRAILLSTLCAVLLAPSIPEFLAANADASFRPGSGIYRCRTEDEIVSGEIDPFYLCPPVDYPSPPTASISDYVFSTEIEFLWTGADIVERWTVPGYSEPVERFYEWGHNGYSQWWGPCPGSFGNCYISPGWTYYWAWFQNGYYSPLTTDNLGIWRYEEIIGNTVIADFEFEVKELVLTEESNASRIGIVNQDLSKPLVFRLATFEDTPEEPYPVSGEVIYGELAGPAGAKNAAVTGIGLGSSTDPNGIDTAFIHLGSKPGTYTLTLNTRWMLTQPTFDIFAVDDIEDLDPEEEHEDTEEDSGEDKDPCDKVGNPISLASGNKFQREVDIEAVGISPIEFVRYHNSLGFVSRSFVNYWTHTYDRHVEIPIDPQTEPVKVVRPDGKKLNFFWNGVGFEPFAGVKATLAETANGWTFTDNEMTVENFDADGLLVDITDIQGRVQTATYDSNNNIIRIADSLGGSLDFTYDAEARLSTVTDQANRTWTYRYEILGRLAYVDRPDGTTREYHYEDLRVPYALTGITLENGQRYSWYEYDDQGLAIASYHANGADRVDIQYQANGDRIVLDPRGNATVYQTHFENKRGFLDSVSGPVCSQGCGQTDTQFTYDANKNIISKTAYGITTQYGGYDAKGQPGFMVEALGLPEEKRTDFEYDPSFYDKVTRITEPSIYAGASKVTTRNYDVNGNVLSETISGFDPLGQPISRTVSNAFDGPFGQISSSNGPRNDVSDITSFEYYPNAQSEGSNRGRLKAVIDPNGIQRRDNITYSPTGKVLSEVRPNGTSVAYEYYAGNDRIKSVSVTGGGLVRRTEWEYYESGEVEWLTFDDELGQEIATRFWYDSARRLNRIEARVTRGGPPYYLYEYDHVETFEFDDVGNVTNVTSSAGANTIVIDRVFDAHNRIDAITQGGVIENFDYNPNGTLGEVTDGNLNTTTYTYDAFKRLTNVQQIGQIDTTMTYDSHGNNLSVTDPLGNTTQYLYDDLGNRVQTESPDTGITTFDFNEAGQVVTEANANGQVSLYTYDASGRITGIDRAGIDYDITYVYDVCSNGVGKLCEISTGWGHTIQYEWNAIGELRTMTSNEGEVSYTFGPLNTLTSITYPSGRIVSFDIDGGGLPTQIRLSFAGVPDSILVDDIGYSPLGRPVSWIYGNGQQTSISLDARHRPTSIDVPGVWSWQATQYDNNDNLQGLTNSNDTFTFGYDELNRLTSAIGTQDTIGYDYDDVGNRLSKTTNGAVVSGTYQPGTNRISTYGGNEYTLDAAGNTVAMSFNQTPEVSYVYSSHNRLIEVVDEVGSSTMATYRYDGLGQRVEKITAAESRKFIYGLNGELLAEFDSTGEILHEFVYLNGQPVVDLGELPQGPPPPAPQEVIIDDTDADVLGANWQTQSHSLAENGGYVKNRKRTNRLVRWFIDETGAAGTYDIYVKWFNAPGEGTSTYYEVNVVNSAGTGSESTPVIVNHADHAQGDWVYFGNFDIKPLQSLRQDVVVSGFGNPYGYEGTFLEADAVKLVPTFAPSGYFSIRYIHGDHLGTPQIVTDDTGEIIWSARYLPFGEVVLDEDPDGDLETYNLNIRFHGQYFDYESGLHSNYFRDYDPSTGRYLESDPIGLNGGVNTYSYVLNNPLFWVDPLGLEPYPDSRNRAIGIVIGGQIGTGLEHACAVCCVPDSSGGDALDCNLGPTKKGNEKTVQVPVCKIGFPREYVHSHPPGRPTLSDADTRTASESGVTVTAVEPNGRGQTYTPGSGEAPYFSHNFGAIEP